MSSWKLECSSLFLQRAAITWKRWSSGDKTPHRVQALVIGAVTLSKSDRVRYERRSWCAAKQFPPSRVADAQKKKKDPASNVIGFRSSGAIFSAWVDSWLFVWHCVFCVGSLQPSRLPTTINVIIDAKLVQGFTMSSPVQTGEQASWYWVQEEAGVEDGKSFDVNAFFSRSSDILYIHALNH